MHLPVVSTRSGGENRRNTKNSTTDKGVPASRAEPGGSGKGRPGVSAAGAPRPWPPAGGAQSPPPALAEAPPRPGPHWRRRRVRARALEGPDGPRFPAPCPRAVGVAVSVPLVQLRSPWGMCGLVRPEGNGARSRARGAVLSPRTEARPLPTPGASSSAQSKWSGRAREWTPRVEGCRAPAKGPGSPWGRPDPTPGADRPAGGEQVPAGKRAGSPGLAPGLGSRCRGCQPSPLHAGFVHLVVGGAEHVGSGRFCWKEASWLPSGFQAARAPGAGDGRAEGCAGGGRRSRGGGRCGAGGRAGAGVMTGACSVAPPPAAGGEPGREWAGSRAG